MEAVGGNGSDLGAKVAALPAQREQPTMCTITAADVTQLYINASALRARKTVTNAKRVVYPGAAAGLTETHKEKLDVELLSLLKSRLA